MLTIKIKYFNDKLEKVAKITKGNWIDLRAAEDGALKAQMSTGGEIQRI